jgi:hypothetical protein
LKNPVDLKTRALTTYWMAEAMYEVRKYTESVSTFQDFLELPEAPKHLYLTMLITRWLMPRFMARNTAQRLPISSALLMAKKRTAIPLTMP